jgi:hypothetical protein
MAEGNPRLKDGFYIIENKQYGPVNRGKNILQDSIPVVAAGKNATVRTTAFVSTYRKQ